MIYHTLLPKEEVRALRREYRTRLAIVTLFFVSSAAVLGIITLLPTYFHAQGEEQEVRVRQDEIAKSRKASGADEIAKRIAESQAIAAKIVAEEDKYVYSGLIEKIVSLRPKDIVLTSFSVSRAVSTTTGPAIAVQGKASTREVLLSFENSLKADPRFSDVVVPLSDLAKNRNINFAFYVTVAVPKP